MPLRHSTEVDRLSCDIWERIAFYTVAAEDSFLGPPSIICSLVLVSSFLYDHISHKKNFQLYARIFRFKFDSSAITRRLSARWRTTKCLTAELVKRFQTFKRMRSMDLEVNDLWTIYLMMSENDGKNEAQLFRYAGLTTYIRTLFTFRATSPQFAWFQNRTLDSLALWLLWETTERESIRDEGQGSVFSDYLVGILHSFLITRHQHSSTYAPDAFFEVPLCSYITIEDLTNWAPPPMSEIVHYSHRLRLASPVVAPAVIQRLAVQADSFQSVITLPRQLMESLPPTPADAPNGGLTAHHVEDFHLNNRPHLFPRCHLVVGTRYVEDLEVYEDEILSDGQETCRRGSLCQDEDWYRIVSCQDPWQGDLPLRGVVYRPGVLSGSWAGRFLLPNLSHELRPSVHGSAFSVRHHPLYWELQEHHCMSSDGKLPPGNCDDFSDDVLNAWLPKGVVFNHTKDALEVFDPNTGHTARYQTFIPRNAATFPSTSASEKLLRSGISGSSEEEIAGNCAPELVFGSLNPGRSLDPSLTAIDDDDEYSDTISHISSGVTDILITGNTGENYGQAWGHFTIHGRVRPWDGLVVLLRFPTDPVSDRHLGRWIFKGYLHDQNLVGLWRDMSTPLQHNSLGGGFVVYKTSGL